MTSDLYLIDSFKVLDKLIADKIMGWQGIDWDDLVVDLGKNYSYGQEYSGGWAILQANSNRRSVIWNPSQCMISAWIVVEKMCLNHEFTLERGWSKHPAPAWHCHIGLWDATADTPALAICIASLLAVGIVVKPATPLCTSWWCWAMGEAIT